MATIHAEKNLENGNHLVLVEVAGSGGGRFYSPGYLKLVELDSKEYRASNSKNVRKVHAEREFNAFSTQGPRSRFGKQLVLLTEKFDQLH